MSKKLTKDKFNEKEIEWLKRIKDATDSGKKQMPSPGENDYQIEMVGYGLVKHIPGVTAFGEDIIGGYLITDMGRKLLDGEEIDIDIEGLARGV